MPTHRITVGMVGESVAAEFLHRRGAIIVDRNVRVGRDEIDLVIRIDGDRAAVEVKTGLGCGTRPWENFDNSKEARTRRAARTLGIRRVDLVAIELKPEGVVVRWSPGSG